MRVIDKNGRLPARAAGRGAAAEAPYTSRICVEIGEERTKNVPYENVSNPVGFQTPFMHSSKRKIATAKQTHTTKPIRVVAVGASAGGLEAFSTLLRRSFERHGIFLVPAVGVVRAKS